MQQTYTIGPRTFVLDKASAEDALAAKRVVEGRGTMTFNLLPPRYPPRYVCAYELYRTMKENHRDLEDVPMQRDVQQLRSESALSDVDRWIVPNGGRLLLCGRGDRRGQHPPRRPVGDDGTHRDHRLRRDS